MKFKKRNLSLSIIVALSFTVILQATPAVAGKQVYPGSMCVRWNVNKPVPVLNHSRIFNDSSTQQMKVDCPILHQNFNNSSGNNLDDADIGVIDGSTSQNATCWMANRYQTGSTLFGSSGGTRSTTGWGNHEQNLDFNGHAGRSAQNWYYIGCKIPPKDGNRRSGITYYSGQD